MMLPLHSNDVQYRYFIDVEFVHHYQFGGMWSVRLISIGWWRQ